MSVRARMKKLFPTIAFGARKAERAVLKFVARAFPFLRVMQFAGYSVYYRIGNSLVARVQRAGGSYEPEMIACIVELLRSQKEPVFLDIGANIGLVTFAVKRAVPTAQVYAFEPGPVQGKLLQRTIEKNSLTESVSLIKAAVTDREGTIPFFTHTGGDEAKDGLVDTLRGTPAQQINVPAITLDSWANTTSLERVSVIKIDTEGAELMVLRGASGLIRQSRPVVFFELDERNLRPYLHEAEDILDFFSNHDYSVQTLTRSGVSKENVRESMKTADTFMAVPQVG